MAIITDSGCIGTVTCLCIHTAENNDITTIRRDSVGVSFKGFDGDSHSGLVRASCVRVKQQYKPGTTIRNSRQVSIVSDEELALIAKRMELAEIKPEWLGANLSLSGIPDFTRIPPATRLLFSGGVSLVIDVENEPCKYPADIIEAHYAGLGKPGLGKRFVKSAIGVRGVTAWVEREGILEAGDSVEVHTPPVCTWIGRVQK